MTTRSRVAVAVAAVLLAGCVDPEPSTPTPEDLGEIDLSPDHTITVDDDGFDPASLTVESGDVVLLVNEGSGPHSFTAEERFDTGRLESGEDSTLVLTEPGEIPSHDLHHPESTGTLTIVEASTTD